jgi:very-short-patch-repair endonuclease
MKYAIPQNITEISRMLRQKMTPAEKILWQSLRSKKI